MFQAFIVGVLAGILFFGGLYLTVQKLNTARHPALVMILSLLIRLVILTGGMFLIMNGSIRNLLAAMAGILLVRFAMIRKLGKAVSPEPQERG